MLFVLSGPSGSGKTTLTNKLVEEFDNLRFVISYTTRKARKSEKNGVDYIFVNKKEFSKMIEENKFIEWAYVHGNYYGTPIDIIRESIEEDFDLLLDINVEGANKIKKTGEQAVYIFLKPPSLEILKRRLLDRGDISGPEIEKRLEAVSKEMEKSGGYDYIIINSELEYSFNKLVDIIRAEREKKNI